MHAAYDLVKITASDLRIWKKGKSRGKVALLLKLVLDEMPKRYRKFINYTKPQLVPIKGFEDKKVRGYEVVVEENKKVEEFIKSYIPFFILVK
jgi:hypothetical protein